MRSARIFVPIISVLALVAGLSLRTRPAAADSGFTWNLSTDFRLSPNEANPNPDSYGNLDVWWLMRGTTLHDPSSYALLGVFDSEFCGVRGVEAWVGPHL